MIRLSRNRRHSRAHLTAHFILNIILFSLPWSAFGQSGGGVDTTGTDGKHTIQGRLFLPSGRTADTRIKVRLETAGLGALSVLTDSNGSFSFRNLSPGSYAIVVEGDADFETTRESIYIEQERSGTTRSFGGAVARVFNIPIYLRAKRRGDPTGHPTKAGVVDVSLLNVPKAAQESYQQGVRAAHEGDRAKAVQHLNNAISVHPQFALALNELGVQYLMLGEAEKAAANLRSAVALSPTSFSPRLNLGIALLNKNDFAGAETQLRQALKISETSSVAHMYLGIALIKLRKHEEAEKELQRAVGEGKNEVGLAHKYLGGLYWAKKDYKRAADELEKYLELSPKAPDAERVRGTVKELRGKS